MIDSPPDHSGALLQLSMVGIVAAIAAVFAARGHCVEWSLISLLGAVACGALARMTSQRRFRGLLIVTSCALSVACAVGIGMRWSQ